MRGKGERTLRAYQLGGWWVVWRSWYLDVGGRVELDFGCELGNRPCALGRGGECPGGSTISEEASARRLLLLQRGGGGGRCYCATAVAPPQQAISMTCLSCLSLLHQAVVIVVLSSNGWHWSAFVFQYFGCTVAATGRVPATWF